MAFIDKKGPKMLKTGGIFLQTLSFYGAGGIMAFGWVLSRLLHFDCGTFAPLWFFGAVFIYNLDRLKSDPADPINIPERSSASTQLRNCSIFTAGIALAALVAIPFLKGKPWLLPITAGGGLVCVNYSLPLLGFRFKDVPLVKTLFAPGFVTVAYFMPPMIQHRWQANPSLYIAAFAWTGGVMLFNMILCDLRDVRGDAATGIRSIPVVLGARRTVFAEAALLALVFVFSFCVVLASPVADRLAWIAVCAAMAIYLAGLLFAARKGEPLKEFFYEWWVEGILFVPLAAYVLVR